MREGGCDDNPTVSAGLGVSRRRDTDAPRPSFEELRDHIGGRLGRAPRYRQRLRSVPLGLNAPEWVDDPGFDLCQHVLRGDGSDVLPRAELWALRTGRRATQRVRIAA